MPDPKAVKAAIRTVAQQLRDADRAAQINRVQLKAERQERYTKSVKALQWRYEHEREALLAEYVYTCPYCGKEHEPSVYETPDRPHSNPLLGVIPGHLSIRCRETCGCPQEAEALRLERIKAEQQRREFEAQEWKAALVRAGLVGKLALATFDSYDAQDQAQKIQKGAALQYCTVLLRDGLGDSPWLVLYGPYGLGKTHLACAVLHEAMREGWRQCYFRPWAEYLRRLMNSFENDAEERTGDITAELMTGKLVVIDDLDSKPPSRSGFAEAELFTALNRRYNDQAPTILTFNRTPLEMKPWLGAAVVDRLTEVQFQAVEFRGNSHRSNLRWAV